MTTAQIITALNTAIKDNSLVLSDAISGISWSSDLPTALQTYFKVTDLSITSSSLTASLATTGAVKVAEQAVPSVVLKGQLGGSDPILGIPAADIDLMLYATPAANEKVDFTLIVQFKNSGNGGLTGWTPADSFAGLADQMVFKVLIADDRPSFLLSSFVHDQSWNYQAGTPGNTFTGVQVDLNLQVPAGISTKIFPPLTALFGSETLAQLYFNGTVDNSKTTSEAPEDISISLMAVMGSNYSKSLSGSDNAPIKLEFDLGFDAFPASTADPNSGEGDGDGEQTDDAQGMAVLESEVVLQARIGPAIIRAIIPFTGSTISFSMAGINGQPALSITDIEQLFSKAFLTAHLPPGIIKNGQATPAQMALYEADDKCAGESFLDRVGIYNLGMTIHMPTSSQELKKGEMFATSGKPQILSILLKVGYDCTPIGFEPWFDLKEFYVTFSVQNPFTPESSPKILLDGDLELLKGDITFEATFAKKTVGGESSKPSLKAHRAVQTDAPTSQWVFSIEGDLKEAPPTDPPNVIDLSSVLAQFDSHSQDLPEVVIDALSFSAEPAEKTYAISFEIESDPPWKFLGFANPAFDSLALDINKTESGDGTALEVNNPVAVYTGSIDTKFSFASSHPAKLAANDDTGNMIVFELSATRTEDSWIFKGTNEDAFTLEDFGTAMGLTNTPEYLSKVDIKQIAISYTAPISPPGGTQEDTPPPPGSSVFEITIDTTFGIANKPLEVILDFKKEKDSWCLDGSLIIGAKPAQAANGDSSVGLEFDFSVSSSGSTGEKDTTLKASLSEKSGKALNISDFATALGVTPPQLPEALNDIALISAGFEYETDPKGMSFLFKASSEEYGNIVFVIVKTGKGAAASWKPFFGINFKPTLDFNKLPVVGSLISKFGTLAVEDIMLAGIVKLLDSTDIEAMNKLLQEPDNLVYPQLPAATNDTIPAEVIFDATLDLNGDKQKLTPIIIPLKGSPPPQENKDAIAALEGSYAVIPDEGGDGGEGGEGGEVGKSSDKKVGKSFGPVTIQKFNISYADGAIIIDVNGSLTLAGMEMSFEGLGMHMKFPPKSISDVSFQLHGLGINLQKGDLRIAGGFIAAGPESDPFDSLMGMLAINAGTIGLQAFGGYSTSPESFFIFLHLEIPIGGPPFFFVDGLSGGFGINRDFILPGFDELGTFPLLPAAANNPIPSGPPAPEGESKPSIDDITKVLLDLAKYIPPKEGAYWIAVGLDFTSFELLQVSAILEVTFGKDFQVGLLGNASMSIPEPVEPIAFISINFEVIFAPSRGILAALGEITPSSFLFSSASQLTGGFAFYTWFSGSEHEGDFVVTIGGYHPDFKPPAWYPVVPRLELKWDLGPLHIDGKTFFALTPHVLMAGLDISATWSGGPVKAWFDMGIDFILGWKPFFYEAEAYIHLGASIHILFTITIHIGADITIWGPQFGGKATIDLDIISFTIHFGSKGPTPPPIPWSEFKKLMPNTYPQKSAPEVQNLEVTTQNDTPSTFAVSTITMAEGLLKEISKDPLALDDLSNDKVFNWLIDPNHFQFHIAAGVPSNNFTFNEIVASTDSRLTPETGSGEYVLPSDLASFYSNPNVHQDPKDIETIFAYNYEDIAEADYWWKQEIGVAPVDIAAEDFGSTLQLKLYNVGDGKTIEENNIVLTAVSNNAAKSLWGSQVTASNGSGGLNAKSTIKNTLGGMTISAKIYHPLQTRSILLYDLIFQQGNQVNWEPITVPTIGPNSFEETVSTDGNNMSFKDNGDNTVNSEYRILDTQTFAQLKVGETIINDINMALGLTGSDALVVDTNAVTMAAPRYQDWPVLALLGEEDKNED